MTVAAPLPAALAVFQIEGDQHAVVEPVHESVPVHHVGELRLQATGLPQRRDEPGVLLARLDLEELAADAVAAREEHPVPG